MCAKMICNHELFFWKDFVVMNAAFVIYLFIGKAIYLLIKLIKSFSILLSYPNHNILSRQVVSNWN